MSLLPIIPGHDLLRLAGSGGSGDVYEATRTSDGVRVAIKLLHGDSATHGESAMSTEGMAEEFRLLSTLDHPSLVSVFDFGVLGSGRAWFSMEWLDGQPVSHDAMKGDAGSLDAALLADFLMQTSAALEYLHSRNRMHGDLKPANIILISGENEGRRYKLMDFGIAAIAAAHEQGLSGTVEYMAPELIRGERLNASSDLYAVGCLLFELITGQPPFTAGSAVDVLKQHLHTLAPPVPNDVALPEEFSEWTSVLLEKQPQLRFRNAFQLHEAAAGLLGLDVQIGTSKTKTGIRLLDVPRAQEHSRALEVYDESAAKARVLCIDGVDGIGKTRFLRALTSEMQIGGAKVLQSLCSTDKHLFAPVLEMISTVMTGAADTFRPEAAVVATVFPDILRSPGVPESPGVPTAGRTQHSGSVSDLSPESQKLRVFRAAATILTAADRQTGTADVQTVCVLDDLHLADSFTREFVSYLSSYLDANDVKGFLFIVAWDSGQDREKKAASLNTLPFCQLIRLLPLTSEQLEQNLSQLFGQISTSFVNVLQQQSDGVPGRIEELLDFCLSEGIVEQTTHGWLIHERENLGSVFPASLRQMFKRKIERLDKPALSVLHVLAISKHDAGLSLLALVTGIPPDRLREVAQELVSDGLAEVSHRGYSCSHPVVTELAADITEVAAEKMPREEEYHDAFIRWYDGHQPAGDADTLLGYHHLHSSRPREAIPHLLAAADTCERAFDYRGAGAIFHQILPLIPDSDIDRRFDLLQRLAEVNNVLGRRADEEEILEEMLLLAAQSNSTEKLASVYRSQTEFHLSTAEYSRARRSAEKALGYYTETGSKTGQAYCHQKIGLIRYRTKPDASVLEHYERARSLFAEERNSIDEGNILIDIGLVYYSILEEPDKALQCFGDARVCFETVKYTRGITRTWGNAGAQLYSLGRYSEALEHHAHANELSRQSGDLKLIATSCGAIGQCELALCRYSPALLHLQEELRISREIGDGYLQELCYENLGELYLTLGAYDMSLEAYAKAREYATSSGNDIGVAAGDIDMAGALIEKRDFDAAGKLLKKARSVLGETRDINVQAMLLYREGMFYLAKSAQQDFTIALSRFNELGDLSDKHGFASHSILARSYAAFCQFRLGRTAIALELSGSAIESLEETESLYGGTHDILYNHALILRASKEAAKSAEFIASAYRSLMANAESISEQQLYRSYLEQVQVNADIVREYAIANRGDSTHALSAVREHNLRTLYDVARKINSLLDLDQLLNNIMDGALEAMNGERGMIFLIEDEQLALKVSRNVEKETIQDATEISLSILRDVLHAGRPIIVSDTSADEEFSKRDSVINFHIHSLICVPMKSRDRIIGTVYVDSRAEALAAMSFSEIDADFLEAFANLATIAIENARMHESMKQENVYLRREIEQRFGFENIIGSSKPMEKLFTETQAAITSESNVLIYGESGTGKELIAKAIHYNGKRKDNHFVAVDCGALPDTLLESELFGYMRGAFTGAVTDKPGLFEEAHNGTLFLDEISNTSLAFQAKMLRVLQEGEFRRVGETKIRRANVRIICATNSDLQKEIRQERFRQDLFYRLNVIPITVPPLRDRSYDIPELVQHFIHLYNEKNGSDIHGASNELTDILKGLPWKGNIRELENLVNRILAQTDETVLSTKHLPAEYRTNRKQTSSSGDLEVSLRAPQRLQPLKEMEKEHINFVLQHTAGNKTEAAKILGLKRTTLVEKMKKLGMM